MYLSKDITFHYLSPLYVNHLLSPIGGIFLTKLAPTHPMIEVMGPRPNVLVTTEPHIRNILLQMGSQAQE